MILGCLITSNFLSFFFLGGGGSPLATNLEWKGAGAMHADAAATATGHVTYEEFSSCVVVSHKINPTTLPAQRLTVSNIVAYTKKDFKKAIDTEKKGEEAPGLRSTSGEQLLDPTHHTHPLRSTSVGRC
uniref:Uncharacterized protein n=1 Tax=Arundo donax TaxID=35708 RepID=A0A0A9AJ26_ARUDO